MLNITTHIVTDYQQNARILTDTVTSRVCIVDPGGEIPVLLGAIDLAIYTIESIYITHCHIDHAGGILKLQSELKKRGHALPKLYYHRNDVPLGLNIKQYALRSGLNPDHYDNTPPMDIDTAQIETFKIGSKTARQFHIPGHAPGHTVLFFDSQDATLDGKPTTTPILIAGDTLFKGSIGRTDLPGGNHADLITNIKTKLFTLPDTTLVLPGHGSNTTIGQEKAYNPYF